MADISKIWKASHVKLLAERRLAALVYASVCVVGCLSFWPGHSHLDTAIFVLCLGVGSVVALNFIDFAVPLDLMIRRSQAEEFASFTRAVGLRVRNKKLFVLAVFAAASALALAAHLPADFVALIAAAAIWSAVDAGVIHYRVRSGKYGDIEVEVLEAFHFSDKFGDAVRTMRAVTEHFSNNALSERGLRNPNGDTR